MCWWPLKYSQNLRFGRLGIQNYHQTTCKKGSYAEEGDASKLVQRQFKETIIDDNHKKNPITNISNK